jgi:hypothetical protein
MMAKCLVQIVGDSQIHDNDTLLQNIFLYGMIQKHTKTILHCVLCLVRVD